MRGPRAPLGSRHRRREANFGRQGATHDDRRWPLGGEGFGGNQTSGRRSRRYRVPVRVFVFGAARVEGRPDSGRLDATPVDIGARKPRSIVAALAMTPGRPVSPGLLADLAGRATPRPPTVRCTPTSPASARLWNRTVERGPPRRSSRPPTTATCSTSTERPSTCTGLPPTSAPPSAASRRWPASSDMATHRAGPTGRRLRPWSNGSTRPSPPGTASRTPTCRTTPTCWPSERPSNASAPRRRRPGSSGCSGSASTPASSRPPSRPSPANRCGSVFAPSTPLRCYGPGARSRRWTRSAPSASCSPMTPAWTPGRSWRGSRRPSSARTPLSPCGCPTRSVGRPGLVTQPGKPCSPPRSPPSSPPSPPRRTSAATARARSCGPSSTGSAEVPAPWRR